MYKWPQGRIVRVCLLLLLLAVGGHLAWYSYNAGVAAVSAETGQSWVICGVYAVAALAALGGGIAAFAFHPRAVDFLIAVEGEMTKVEWPKWNSLWRSTLVIAVAIALLSLTLFVVDKGCQEFVSFLNSLGGSLFQS